MQLGLPNSTCTDIVISLSSYGNKALLADMLLNQISLGQLIATTQAMNNGDFLTVIYSGNGVFSTQELLSTLSVQNSNGQLVNFFKNNYSMPALASNIIKNNYPSLGLVSIVWTGDQGNIINKLVQTHTYSSGNISMLAYIYADMTDDYSIEQYIADAKNYFVGLSSTSLEINKLTYHQDFSLAEHHLYGSSRIGMRRYKNQTLIKRDFKILGINADGTYNIDSNSITNQVLATVSTDSFILRSGITTYELTNHLGNVLATITDKKIPVTDNGNNILYYQAEVITATDYYPFGMVMPERNYTATDECGYRYTFNGKETDNETGTQDYGMRIYNPAIAKFLSVDPLSREYPWNSSYTFAENDVIRCIDLEGAEKYVVVRCWEGDKYKGTVYLYLPNSGVTRQIRTGPNAESTMILNLQLSDAQMKQIQSGNVYQTYTNGDVERLIPSIDGLIFNVDAKGSRSIRSDAKLTNSPLNAKEAEDLAATEKYIEKSDKKLTGMGGRILSPKIAEVHFGFDKSESLTLGSEILNTFKDFLAANPDYILNVTGYTDKVGPTDYNKNLGLERANDMKIFLVNAGIDPNRINIATKGESEAEVPENTSDGQRLKDRKIVIQWQPKNP